MGYVACNRDGPLFPGLAGETGHVALSKLLAGYRELVLDLGGEPDRLLEDVGLTSQHLRDPFNLLPVRAIGQLLEDSAAALGCPDFGLRLADRQPMEATMQPLDRLVCTAPTVRDALEYTSRHVGAYNSGLTMEVAAEALDGEEIDCYDYAGDRRGGLYMVDFKLLDGLALFPQLMEHLLLLTHRSIVWLSAGFAQSRVVWLSHLGIGAPVDYARRFNALIRFGQEYDALLFSENDMQTRVAGCDAERFASEARLAALRFPVRGKDVGSRVRHAIFQALTRSEDCSRQNIARRLGFQERTLNRHLFKMGTSFEAIRDDVRRNLAFRYLARPDLTLSDIAGRLGYSELAVLSRCCQRWFGASPRQLRQSLLAARPGIVRGPAPKGHERSPWPQSRPGVDKRQPISML